MRARQLRVMTVNLWNTRVDADAFGELCRALDLDVVCAQELAGDAADALETLFPHGDLRPSDDFSGMGIALRHPAKLETLDLFHKNGQVAGLEPEDWPQLTRPLQIINLHFAAPGPRRVPSSLSARRRQLAQVQGYLGSNRYTGARLLIGDFNSTPVWPLYQRMSAHGQDLPAAVARRLGRRPRRTWGPTSRFPRLLRIDHAFGSGVQAVAAWVVEIGGSDHSALVLDIEEVPEEFGVAELP